jgi:hypothetical protein
MLWAHNHSFKSLTTSPNTPNLNSTENHGTPSSNYYLKSPPLPQFKLMDPQSKKLSKSVTKSLEKSLIQEKSKEKIMNTG